MNFIIQIIVGVLLSVASTLLQQAFAPQQDQQRRTGTRGSAQIGGKVPQYFLVGTVGEPGKLEYRNAWGNAGGVPNAYVVSVYSIGDLPITALSKVYVNGVEEPISSSGHVTQGYPATGDKAGVFWAEFFDGTQTVASSYLTGKFGSDADRPWTSDMVGVGIPYLITTAIWDEGKWTSIPTVLGEYQGIKLYDPRQDTTAGGSGPQRWDNPSTWAFSDNNMVIIYNIERGIYYDGAHVWGGKKTAADLPYAPWAAAMDACDEDVDLDAGGTEKRFRAGRRVALNERPGDVIKELLIGCNGRIAHCADGTVYPLVGVPDVADGAFSDADVLVTEPLGSIPFPNLDGIINGATATYREPLQAWEDKESAPYLRSDLETEDDGRQQIEGLDLGTTFSGTQAQRIIKAVIEEGRRFRTHVVALPPEFAQFRPLQVLAWTSDRFDYTAKLFLITARTVEPFGNVVFGLQEIDPADHDWDPETDEQPLSFAPVVTNRPAPQPMTGWAVAPYIFPDSDGGDRRVGIEVSYADSLPDVRAVRVQVYEDFGDDNLVFDGEVPYDPGELDPSRAISWGGIIPETDYQVRGKYVPFSGRETDWSGLIAVTTPSVPEIDVSDIQVTQLGQDLLNAYGLVTGAEVTDIPARLAQLTAYAQTLALAVMDFNATTKETLKILSVQSAAGAAAVIRNEKAIVAEGFARAEALTEVLAQVDDVIAGGLLKFEAEVDDLASTATITAKVRATSGTDLSEAAWLLKAEADGLGGTLAQFGVLGNFYVFASVDGPPIPVFYADEEGAHMQVADIGHVKAGLLTSPDETSFIISLTGNEIELWEA